MQTTFHLKKMVALAALMIASRLEASLLTIPDKASEEQERQGLIKKYHHFLACISLGKEWHPVMQCPANCRNDRFALCGSELIDVSALPKVSVIALREHCKPIMHAAFSDDQRFLATASEDACFLWDLQGFPDCTGHRLEVYYPVSLIEFSSKSSLFIGSGDGRCTLHTFEEKKQGQKLSVKSHILTNTPQGKPVIVRFSFSGKSLAIGFESGTIALFTISHEEIREIPARNSCHTNPITALVFDVTENYMISAAIHGSSARERSVQLWDLSKLQYTNEARACIMHESTPENVRVNSLNDGFEMVRASNGKKIALTKNRHSTPVDSIFSSDDGHWIITLANPTLLADGEAFIPPCFLWNLSLPEPLAPQEFYYSLLPSNHNQSFCTTHTRKEKELTLLEVCQLPPFIRISLSNFDLKFASTTASYLELSALASDDIMRLVTLAAKHAQGVDIIGNLESLKLYNQLPQALRAILVAHLGITPQLQLFLKAAAERGELLHSQ